MRQATYITTSYDDGHPLDFRVAELLTKYGLRGTFYVPMSAEHGTMTVSQIRDLSRAFEICAHTLDHVILTRAAEQQAWREHCVGKSIAWSGIVHKCYRDSFAATSAVAALLGADRAMGTWRSAVDVYLR